MVNASVAANRDSPFDDTWDVLSSQAFDGSVDLQVLLQSDPGPQRVHLWTVAHVLQRIIHLMKLCAVVAHQHLDKRKQTGNNIMFHIHQLHSVSQFDSYFSGMS